MSSFLKEYNKNFEFTYSEGFTGNDGINFIFAIGKTKNNNTGVLVKIDENGKYLWGRKYTIPNNINVEPLEICEYYDGKYLLHGYAGTEHVILIINKEGDLQQTYRIDIPNQFSRECQVFVKGNKGGKDWSEDAIFIVLSEKFFTEKNDPIIGVFQENGESMYYKTIKPFVASPYDPNPNPTELNGKEIRVQAIDTQANQIILAGTSQDDECCYITTRINFSYKYHLISTGSENLKGTVHDVKIKKAGKVEDYNDIDMIPLITGTCGNNNQLFAVICDEYNNQDSWREKVYLFEQSNDYKDSSITHSPEGITIVGHDNEYATTILEAKSIQNGNNELYSDSAEWKKYEFSIPGVSSSIIKNINYQFQQVFNIHNTSLVGSIDTFANSNHCINQTGNGVSIIISDQIGARANSIHEYTPIYGFGLFNINAASSLVNQIADGLVQSPYLALNAAGSGKKDANNSIDGSVMGIHLRWMLTGRLGNNHIPKGNLAGNNNNFNRANDFVTIWRTPYVKTQRSLDLADETPVKKIHDEYFWIYQVGADIQAKLIFHDRNKYNRVLKEINPDESPFGFITSYGDKLMELEVLPQVTASSTLDENGQIRESEYLQENLFFGVKLEADNTSNNAYLKVETLSDQYLSPENDESASSDTAAGETPVFTKKKVITSRKTFGWNDFNDMSLLCENGRSVRFRCFSSRLFTIYFEFYNDVINTANSNDSWTMIDNHFSLTNETALAEQRLETTSMAINEKWPRYVNGMRVDSQRYKDRWNSGSEPGDWGIKEIVEQYIAESDKADNSRAMIKYKTDDSAQEDPQNPDPEISLVDVLNYGATDFHIARMLGLGTIDNERSILSDQKYIYLMEYDTSGDLDGYGPKNIHHISISLPTSISDTRLPLPVKIEKIVPGIVGDNESETSGTDKEGYTNGKLSRFISLIAENEMDFQEASFFSKLPYFGTGDFEAHQFTLPVFAGVQYKNGTENTWRTPDLSHTYYKNSLNQMVAEIIPLVVSENRRVIYVHQQQESGKKYHYYKAYGINLFSRSNIVDDNETATVKSIYSEIDRDIQMKAPTNIMALLIRKEPEEALVLTTPAEQTRLNAITGSDKTLIRLTFDHNGNQDLFSYRIDAKYDMYTDSQIEASSTIYPDDEPFAEEAEILFRNKLPKQISGKITGVKDHPGNKHLSVITTGSYHLQSTGETLTPSLTAAEAPNFIHGILNLGDEQYVVHSIDASKGSSPVITVYKREISSLITGENSDDISTKPVWDDNLESPKPEKNDGLFLMIENMQEPAAWGTPNPLSFKVPLNHSHAAWKLKRKVFSKMQDGVNVRFLEKSKGFWAAANITKSGKTYTVTFQGFNLPTGLLPDSPAGNSVDWYKGQVRVPAASNTYRSFEVISTDRSGANLVLRFEDATEGNSGNDPVKTGLVQDVNYYPGYKVYLYANAADGLTSAKILPSPYSNDEISYNILALRTRKGSKRSKISTPTVMFAQKIEEPQKPADPTVATYTTRPDSYGRSTFSITAAFNHAPHSVLFYRTNENAILRALYKHETLYGNGTTKGIMEKLEEVGGVFDEAYLNDRWKEVITLKNSEGETLEQFTEFPLDGVVRYSLPLPDHASIVGENPGNITSLQTIIKDGKTLGELAKEAIYATCDPLTEIPIIFQHVKSHEPMPKAQSIRDKNGQLLAPDHDDFDIAPMAKKLGDKKMLFTDFTIDAGARNIYFYCSREMNGQMVMGEYSEIAGPVKPLNTNPPAAPEIRRVIPVLGDPSIGESPSIKFEINPYSDVLNIRRVTLYRAYDASSAQSVRSMQAVKTITKNEEEPWDSTTWEISDDFTNEEIPYGDPFYYRLTASREVEYVPYGSSEVSTEYVASEASKIVMTTMVDTVTPAAPLLDYSPKTPVNNELRNVTLTWLKTAYNAKYRVYKMTVQGNWEELPEDGVQTADNTEFSYNAGTLAKVNEDGNTIYHHFKVTAENTSGLLSTEENILTI